jgi:hypothetical protein
MCVHCLSSRNNVVFFLCRRRKNRRFELLCNPVYPLCVPLRLLLTPPTQPPTAPPLPPPLPPSFPPSPTPPSDPTTATTPSTAGRVVLRGGWEGCTEAVEVASEERGGRAFSRAGKEEGRKEKRRFRSVFCLEDRGDGCTETSECYKDRRKHLHTVQERRRRPPQTAFFFWLNASSASFTTLSKLSHLALLCLPMKNQPLSLSLLCVKNSGKGFPGSTARGEGMTISAVGRRVEREGARGGK